jgi:hypothetical protein
VGKALAETIDGKQYIFDKGECSLTFKKLKSAYGEDFCSIFTE